MLPSVILNCGGKGGKPGPCPVKGRKLKAVHGEGRYAGQVVGYTSPFPVNEKIRDRIPEGMLDEKTYRSIKLTKVPLKGLIATQRYLRKPVIDKLMKKSGKSSSGDSVEIVRYKGKNYIIDGHHRAATAYARGEKTIQAKYFSVKGGKLVANLIIEALKKADNDVVSNVATAILWRLKGPQIVNAFCKTGKGGGVDPTCGSGGKTTKSGETLTPAVRGKNKKWRLANGKEAPDHIQKLGIPPAWNKVHVNLNPKGTLLATGVDAKGRSQSKYSLSHSAKAAAAKFGRVAELSKKRGGDIQRIGKGCQETFSQGECRLSQARHADRDETREQQRYGC